MEEFLSCDWGTSSFRLRLVEITGAKIVAEENSDQGIAKVFDLWKRTGKPEELRFSFYVDLVAQCIRSIEQKLNRSLDKLPLVVSGMACSTLGMIDLPYKEVPFLTDGSDLVIKFAEVSNDFKHEIIFISGARTEGDAMRGEETQLVGCFRDDQREQLFIFPGTHSKHVIVENGKVVGIKTFMTGEFFALLSEKSILSASVERTMDLSSEKNRNSFEAGVKESLHSNLLNTSFKVRTNYLFHKLSQQENYHYLSGVIIGNEMKEATGNDGNIVLVSNSQLQAPYEAAFNVIVNGSRSLKIQNADKAIVAGQLKILNRLLKQKRCSDVL